MQAAGGSDQKNVRNRLAALKPIDERSDVSVDKRQNCRSLSRYLKLGSKTAFQRMRALGLERERWLSGSKVGGWIGW